jgi:outer membrane protein assembly factor BamE (lipoprotein component of BamABCDE complex)
MSSALHSIEAWLIALAITVAILAGFGIFSRWCAFSPAVSRRKLDQLRVGMSMDEVRTMLGEPRDATYQGDGSSQWVYGARVKRHMLIIEFSSKASITGFAHGIPDRRRAPASPKDT